jgi:hypothetical protein
MVFPKYMHLFIISQPTLATSLWWFPVWWFCFWERPRVKLTFWRNLTSLEFRMRIVTSCDKPHFLEKVCWFSTSKPFMSSSYLKPCRLIVSSEPFQGCLLVEHIFVNLEPELLYPLQSWRYLWWPHCYQPFSMPSPMSLPHWSLSYTSFIVFAFCISRSVGYQVAPCLWR